MDIERMGLDYGRLRLYQDGLPISDHAMQIVLDLAQAGSYNYRLLVELMRYGAQLTGTEAPELLLEEYELARQVLVSLRPRQDKACARRLQERSQALLDRRDKFIAERIAQTLQPGETGLIFLGMLHSLEGRLPSDMQLCRGGQGLAMDPGAKKSPGKKEVSL